MIKTCDEVIEQMFRDSVDGFLTENLLEMEYQFCEQTILNTIHYFNSKRRTEKNGRDIGSNAGN